MKYLLSSWLIWSQQENWEFHTVVSPMNFTYVHLQSESSAWIIIGMYLASASEV